MPGRDATGPRGQGPMTGRGAGYCADADPSGAAPFGLGRGMGRGRGFRNWFRATRVPFWARAQYSATETPDQEITGLRAQAGWLKNQLAAIDERLKELEDQA